MKIIAVASSLLLYLPTLLAVEVKVDAGLHSEAAQKWVTAILDNDTSAMADMAEFPMRIFKMDVEDKDDLQGMVQSKIFEQWRDFHKNDGWEFAQVTILDRERKKFVAKRSFPDMEFKDMIFVFVRIVDDVNAGRRQPAFDMVVVFSPGPNPRVVAFGND